MQQVTGLHNGGGDPNGLIFQMALDYLEQAKQLENNSKIE